MQSFPSIYALVNGKSKDVYNSLFAKVCELLNNQEFTELSSDFEEALFACAKNQFNTKKVIGCLFHMGQAIQRKIGKLGFKNNYQIGDAFDINLRELIIKTHSIAYIPPKCKKYAVDTILDDFWFNNVANGYKYDLIFKYLENTWLSPNATFPVELWDCCNVILNTNNQTEGSNSKVNASLKGNMSLFSWKVKISKLETQYHLQYSEMQNKQMKKRPKQVIETNARIQVIIREMEKLQVNSKFVESFAQLWQQLALALSKCSKSWSKLETLHTRQFLGL